MANERDEQFHAWARWKEGIYSASAQNLEKPVSTAGAEEGFIDGESDEYVFIAKGVFAVLMNVHLRLQRRLWCY